MNAGALAKSVAAIKSSNMQGTGFFISARLLLTAGHVVKNVAAHEYAIVSFRGRDLKAAVLDKRMGQTTPWPFPDVALLQCLEDVEDALPLLLTERLPLIGTPVYTRGFPLKGEDGGEDAATKVEGQSNPDKSDPMRFRFKLSEGQLRPGMSGAPAVLETGHVAGVITLTRDERSNLGGFFTPTRELVRAFGAQIGNVVANDRPSKIPYVTVPPLPENYISRTEILDELRVALTRERASRSIATIAIQGMGGLGKTLLAQAVSLDGSLSANFPDGIIWIPIGKESTRSVAVLMNAVAKLFNNHLEAGIDDLQATHWYRTALRDKAALIILDDVWHAGDLDSFRAEAPRSRVLFTTRDAGLAETYAAQVITPGFLTMKQSREMLASWSNVSVGALPPDADLVVRECGGLALALAAIGAMVRGKPARYWHYLYGLIRQADFGKLKQQFPDYPYPDLLRALQVSIDALDLKMRERYLALAVMLEEVPVRPLMQRVLWDADEFDALETAEEFVRLALAQRDGEDGSIRLHDLLLDYVRAQYSDREALKLIHGAMRLSSHIVEPDIKQFASQLVGRLLPYAATPAVCDFIRAVIKAAPRPWLRPLKAALQPPDTGLLRTLSGHAGPINAVSITPDGHHAVSASNDRTLKVWELQSGRELHTLSGHTDRVNAVCVTPDGEHAVSASKDRTLKVWELQSGRELHTLSGHDDMINALAVTPDGRCAVSASDDRTLTVWELKSGRQLRTLLGHLNSVNAVAVTPDSQRAVSASDDRTLKVWELDSGRELHTLSGHKYRVNAVAMTPDGRCAVSASEDETLIIWDIESGRELCCLSGHADRVTSVAVTPDGRLAVSASNGGALKVWEFKGGLMLHSLCGHDDMINALAVTPDGRCAVTASNDRTLTVWKLESGRKLHNLFGHAGSVNAVVVTADGQRAVSGSNDQTLKVWELGSSRDPNALSNHAGWIRAVAVTPNRQHAVSASDDGTLKLWEVESGRELQIFSGHTDRVSAVAMTPDGRRVLSGSNDRTLKIWELDSGRELHTLSGHAGWIRAVTVTPDGRRAVSASDDRTLKVWDLESGSELCTLSGHADRIRAVALTPDGRRAVSASNDRTLKVWELESGRELHTLSGHAGRILAVAVTANGRRAVSASDDGTLKIWEIESARELHSLYGHAGRIWAVTVTPDSRRAMAASYDGSLKVWEIESGGELQAFSGHAGWIRAVAMARDGRRIVSASNDGTLKVWEFGSGAPIASFSCDFPPLCCTFVNGSTVVAGDQGGRVHILRLET